MPTTALATATASVAPHRRAAGALRRLAAAAAVLAASIVSFAETSDTESITVGALAERADAVAVVEAVAPREPAARVPDGAVAWRFRVTESVRGTAADVELTVTLPAGRAPVSSGGSTPVAPGGRFLAFLRKSGDDWTTLELPWALRTTAEPGVPALVEYARGYAKCLDADGRVADPAGLAAHLVQSLGAESSGVPFCAGRDLLRHDELHGEVTAAQRALVTEALRRPRKADDDFAAIVLAAGAFGGDGTDALLVGRLLDPANRGQRRNLAAAMRRRASPALAALLSKALDGAEAAQRADLANALGHLDLRDAEAPLTALLADDDAAVRVEAAQGLGLLARAVRSPRAAADGAAGAAGAPADPAAPRPKLDTALPALRKLAEKAATENERRASLWAIAQIDVPAAWDVLRRFAKDHAEPRVRELAQRVLDQPRVSLLLVP